MSRERCPRCYLAVQACVCRYVHRQDNQYPIIILQHPDEFKKPLGTAKLISLGLAKCHISTQLNFSRLELDSVLGGLDVCSPILLHHIYRNDRAGDLQADLSSSDTGLSFSKEGQAYDSLILIDGTFRNVREILMVNEWLNELPRLTIKNAAQSRYRLRKSRVDNALSSIEAVAEILKRIDQPFSEERFLEPFDAMIRYQIKRMGSTTFQNNYLS